MHIQQIVFEDLNKVARRETEAALEPGPGEVIVAPAFHGICGTDLHVLHGKHPWVRPLLVTGHESAGRIAALGPDVPGWAVGDPVVGDKVGRKSSLIATLLIIGLGTFLIGVLPTYSTAGIAAPIMLVVLRLLQGFGLGGEYGVAALMTIEHAPPGYRGFWGSLPQAAASGGILLATGVFALVSRLPQEDFLSWGCPPLLLAFDNFGIAQSRVIDGARLDGPGDQGRECHDQQHRQDGCRCLSRQFHHQHDGRNRSLRGGRVLTLLVAPDIDNEKVVNTY